MSLKGMSVRATLHYDANNSTLVIVDERGRVLANYDASRSEIGRAMMNSMRDWEEFTDTGSIEKKKAELGNRVSFQYEAAILLRNGLAKVYNKLFMDERQLSTPIRNAIEALDIGIRRTDQWREENEIVVAEQQVRKFGKGFSKIARGETNKVPKKKKSSPSSKQESDVDIFADFAVDEKEREKWGF